MDKSQKGDYCWGISPPATYHFLLYFSLSSVLFFLFFVWISFLTFSHFHIHFLCSLLVFNFLSFVPFRFSFFYYSSVELTCHKFLHFYAILYFPFFLFLSLHFIIEFCLFRCIIYSLLLLPNSSFYSIIFIFPVFFSFVLYLCFPFSFSFVHLIF